MKTETGVIAIKNKKAWGLLYADGHEVQYGWMDLEDAIISDPKYVHKPTDLTYSNSPYFAELQTAELVKIQRITTITRL